MGEFSAPDLYRVDDLLSDEDRMVRDTVRSFVSQELLPIIEQHTRAGTFPIHLVPKLGELGLLGANLPGYGCAGLGAVPYGVIQRELERGDSGLRSFVSVQGALAMYPIHTYGSEDQKERWLPRMAAGETIGCFGLTEPDFGSNPAGMTTRAVPDRDGWILNGTKLWITNGGICHLAVVWAKGPDGRVRGFIVERGTPGFTTSDLHGKFSLRASVTSELVFQDCRVPESNRLPQAMGLKAPLSCLNQARYGIAWGAIGSAMAVYDEAVRYAKTRIQFGKPIAAFQLVQRKLAWMLTEITKGQLLAYQLGRLKESGRATHVHVSMAKMNNVKVALEIAREARDILGANGICDEYQVGRHLCNLESVVTYEGTHDIHTLILGEHITGIPAFE
ncbi:MAG: acyl-CoA dehydrogenase family protein [Candidatus Riflebacteria bacterium]|nr:acyl-CoA dehydrogenase family protein [Candidatus Riflebacteria bacterium]